MNECYNWISSIKSLNLKSKSILIVGFGYIGKEYFKALSEMGIKDVSIISLKNNIHNIKNIQTGSYEKILSQFKKKDLVILALPTKLLIPAAEIAIQNGQKNILIEKPGALDKKELEKLSKKFQDIHIKIAYNRLFYPNLHKLKKLVKKDGGITSCNFSFTEWIYRLDFKKYDSEVLQKWGIQNSLHVISMAMDLIGMPKKIYVIRKGYLKWHNTGSVFVGSGISENNIPFTFNSDWGSGGRWSIDVMTKNNWYKLSPLEELQVCPKKSTKWTQISFKKEFPNVKQGIAEEIAYMLDPKIQKKNEFITLENAGKFIKLANKIFGYS
jgi:predicted dehydrogenase